MSNIDHKKYPLQTQFIIKLYGYDATLYAVDNYLKSGHKVISMACADQSSAYLVVLEPPIIKEDEQK